MPDLHALVVVTVPRPWHDARNASNVMRQVLVVLMMWLPSLGCDRAVHVRQSGHDPQNRVEIGAFVPRDPETVPGNEQGALIRIGHQLVTRTQDTVKAFVGNGLNCTNCHLAAGQKIGAAAFVGLSRIYPEYRSRNARVNTLEDRLDDCFARSMNGTPLPAGSREKAALVAYIEWLSEGVTQEEALRWRGFFHLPSTGIPDAKRGALLYETQCSGCHGVDGQGTPTASPVWGPRSYTSGREWLGSAWRLPSSSTICRSGEVAR